MGGTYFSSRNGKLNLHKKATEFMLHLAQAMKSTLTFQNTCKLLGVHVPQAAQ